MSPRNAQTKTRAGRASVETAAMAPPPESALTQPDDLDGHAVRIWQQLAPVLEADGRLMPGDEHGFADLCRVRSMIAQCYSEMGRLTDGGEGTGEKRHATVEFSTLNKLQSMAQRLENRFGLSPMSRKALGIKPKRKTSSVNDALGD